MGSCSPDNTEFVEADEYSENCICNCKDEWTGSSCDVCTDPYRVVIEEEPAGNTQQNCKYKGY